MRTPSYLFGIVWISAVAVGCGGDDGPTNVDAGTLVDRCLMASDMAIVLASRADAGVAADGGAPNPIMEAYQCTITPACAELYFAEDHEGAYQCVNDCLDSKPSGGLSIECRDCFTLEAVSCAAAFCFLDCVSGSTESCTACFEVSCRTRLDACVGY